MDVDKPDQKAQKRFEVKKVSCCPSSPTLGGRRSLYAHADRSLRVIASSGTQ